MDDKELYEFIDWVKESINQIRERLEKLEKGDQ